MRRCLTEDTPAYAAEAIASARIDSRQLAASGGLFVMLLIAISLIEAPIPRWDGHAHKPEDRQSALVLGSLPAYGSASTPIAQDRAEPSSGTVEGSAPWCLHSRAPDTLISGPGGAAHLRAG
jgi:hypothetical protein